MLSRLKSAVGNIFTKKYDSVGSGVLFAGQLPPESGNMIKIYEKSPFLRSVVRKIAGAVSVTNWKLYVVNDENGAKTIRPDIALAPKNLREFYYRSPDFIKGELKEIRSHPLLDLLNEGNYFMSGHEVMFLTQIYLDLVGEAFWRISKNPLDVPESIWPLVPTQVLRIPYPGADEENYLVELGTDKHIRKRELVPKDDIVMFKEPNPKDPYGRGTGMAMTLADELSSDELASKHIRQFFFGGGWPNLLIGIEGISPDECARLERSWNSRFAGVFNRFKAAFVNKKMTVNQIGHSFKDMQLVELRKFNRDLVIQYFGVPPEKFGQLSACYDEYTEVLTSKGWIPWRKITKQDQLAVYDPDNSQIFYENPKEVFVYDHKGIMHHWESPVVDLHVTPNHRMLVNELAHEGRYKFITSEEMLQEYSTNVFSIPITGGFYKKNFRPAHRIRTPYMEGSNMDIGEALLDFLRHGRVTENTKCIEVLIDNCNADLKTVASTIIPHLPYHNQKRIVDVIMKEMSKGSYELKGTYWTRIPAESKDFADVIQWMCANSGYSCVLKATNDGRWSIHINTKKKSYIFFKNVNKQMRITETWYEGKVYCAEVSTGALIVRRNGKMAVCGNSNRSTINMADFFWTKDIILPRVDFIRTTIQKNLVKQFDEVIILDFESPVMQDKEHTLDVMRALPGAFTLNEWRREAGKESLGDTGEKHILRPGETIYTNLEDGSYQNPTDGTSSSETDLEKVAEEVRRMMNAEFD